MKENRFIFILLIVSFIIGIFTLTDYGESWDDHSLQKYADYSLRTYNTWRAQGVMPITSEDLGNYGPSYMMTVMLGSRLLNIFFLVNPSDSRHIFYFLTHLLGIWAFYELGKRWLSENAARYATLLFATQPLFWGHSFMNPKDTPFLAFFMLSLLFGLRMIDSLNLTQHPQSDSPRWLRVTITLGVFTILGLFAATHWVHAWLETLVRSASNGETNIISLIASDLQKVKPEIYIQRYFIFFLWLRAAFFLLFSSFFFFAARRYSATIFHSVLTILFPAMLLGYTTSIRVIAPFAGALITLYALRKLGKRAFLPLITYALITITATYITWPYLWSSPIEHFIEAIQTMSKYPWFGKVLFNGMEYAPTELPYIYLPVLLSIQLTEPFWVLFIIGVVSAYKEKREILGVTALWFIIPLLGFIITRAALYDNFRQIFFILPPIFFMAGLGMESILKRAAKRAVQILLACLLILPGVAAGIRLHPYEYVYYNSLIQNPNKRFELDYWAISYREAAEYVNAAAPANTNIMVVGPGQIADLYIREDLTVLSDDVEVTEPFNYAVITTRYNFDIEMYSEAQIVHKITRKGMVLTVIKKIK